jgi:uncharacterized protein DUF1552
MRPIAFACALLFIVATIGVPASSARRQPCPHHRDEPKFNYIKGLFNKAATGVGIHSGMTGNLLSGAQLTKGAELHGGVSLDQVLASHIGDQTVQPSMVLGCEQPVTGYHETNFSMADSSHISWSSPTSPVPMEVYPSLAFDSLFENRGRQRNLSVLDRVRTTRVSYSCRTCGRGASMTAQSYPC